MRLNLAIAGIGLLAAGCGRSTEGPGTIHIGLNPQTRKWTLSMAAQSPIRSSSGPEASTGAIEGKHAPGEWDVALCVGASPNGPYNPSIVIRFFDHGKDAVRVEMEFKGTAVKGLRFLTFDHVTSAENFTVKHGGESKPYDGASLKGETLEVNILPTNGTITFLAWPR